MDRVARATQPPDDWLVYAPGTDLLRGLGRFDVRAHLVASSRSFRAALPTDQPRLVVLAMPPGRSADLALLARERRRRPTMTAVVLTEGRAGPAGDAAFAGIDAALPLGMGGDELVARLVHVRRPRLSEPIQERTGVPVGDGYVIDAALPELRRGGSTVHLRPREHALLLLLARDPGRVFTRRELLDGAWSSHEVGPRTVDVHIRWLRQKLEVDPAAPRRLITVRGVGYRLATFSRGRHTTARPLTKR